MSVRSALPVRASLVAVIAATLVFGLTPPIASADVDPWAPDVEVVYNESGEPVATELLGAPEPDTSQISLRRSDCSEPTVDGAFMCVELSGDSSAGSLAARDGFSAESAEILPIPEWCVDNFNGGYLVTRFERCAAGTGDVSIYQTVNGLPVQTGGVEFGISDFSYTSNSILAANHQVQVFVSFMWGTGLSTELAINSFCSSCAPNGMPPSLMVQGATYTNITELTATTPSYPWSQQELNFTAPGLNVYSLFYGWHEFRCENEVPGRNPGCVVPDYMPRIVYVSSAVPEFAAHVSAAIASGLPGGSASDPISRTTSQTVIGLNRDASCPETLTRPPGKQCDEYPFASTWDGASNGGPARTFAGCSLSDPSGVGPIGFSRCMIDGADNMSAGSMLGSFYGNQRVINGEEYFVVFVP